MAEQNDPTMEYAELVTVYVPRSYEEYIVVVPILDEHNIRHLDKNAVLYQTDTGGAWACFNPALGPIQVQVRQEDAERARRVLEGVLKKIRDGNAA